MEEGGGIIVVVVVILLPGQALWSRSDESSWWRSIQKRFVLLPRLYGKHFHLAACHVFSAMDESTVAPSHHPSMFSTIGLADVVLLSTQPPWLLLEWRQQDVAAMKEGSKQTSAAQQTTNMQPLACDAKRERKRETDTQRGTERGQTDTDKETKIDGNKQRQVLPPCCLTKSCQHPQL